MFRMLTEICVVQIEVHDECEALWSDYHSLDVSVLDLHMGTNMLLEEMTASFPPHDYSAGIWESCI